MQYIGWHSSAFGLCSFALSLRLSLSLALPRRRLSFPLSRRSMYSRVHVPLPLSKYIYSPLTLARRSRTCVYACKFVRDMRLPVRRESNAGSQPLQAAASSALTAANFSSRIESLLIANGDKLTTRAINIRRLSERAHAVERRKKWEKAT